MISQVVKGLVCLRLLPGSGAVSSTAVRGVQRGAYYHHRLHHRPASFRWTTRGGGSGGRAPQSVASSSSSAAASVAASSNREPRQLADAPASLLATVEAVASDVDGTLTTPEVTVTPRTKDAIKAVLDSELAFFPATGKASQLVRLAHHLVHTYVQRPMLQQHLVQKRTRTQLLPPARQFEKGHPAPV